MPPPTDVRRASTRFLSLALIAIGVALLVRTVQAGGGALATGIVLGVLFVAAGTGRLWISLRRRD